MRCHLLTAVWGPWHTDRFVNVNLPSLLSPNNLPEFARRIDTTYVIATSKTDGRIITSSPAYQALSKHIRLRIVAYPDRAFGAPVPTHMKIWHKGVSAAAQSGAFFAVNPADMAWADGSFKTVAERLAAGKKAIYAMFARVVDETFTPEALKLRGQDGSTTIPPRAMIHMTLRHLHPFHAAYLRDSDQFPFHAEYVYWPVDGEGLLMRSLATTVLGFYPAEYSVNSNFSLETMDNPSEVDFIDDSDDLCGVSLTPLLKDQSWYSSFRTIDVEEVGAWWITFDGAAHLPLAATRFHFHTGGKDSPAWQRARRMSDFFVLQTTISREIIRIGRLLKRNGCSIAAEILATALYAGRLRRRWHWRSPVSIFVPNDEALAPYRQNIVDELLTPGREKELIDFVLAHIFSGSLVALRNIVGEDETLTATDQKLVSTNGHALTVTQGPQGLTAGGRKVLAKVDLPLENRLYVVDDFLPTARITQRSREVAAEKRWSA